MWWGPALAISNYSYAMAEFYLADFYIPTFTAWFHEFSILKAKFSRLFQRSFFVEKQQEINKQVLL